MSINKNHPSFLLFLDNVTNNILSQVNLDNYFNLSSDKKLSVQYIVFKLTKTALSINTNLLDSELKEILNVLRKRNESSENYEFAAILKDIIANFDTLKESFKSIKKEAKISKNDSATK